MSVEYKPSVNLDVIPKIRNAISTLESIFAQYGYILYITSARDSIHSDGSLHYIGAAIDFRSKGLPSHVKSTIYSSIKKNFPSPTWWTDLEFLGEAEEHFHIGYNPARRRADSGFFDSMMSFVPVSQQSEDAGYTPDSDSEYPSYPQGTIPPEYFTPIEQPIDWTIYVGVAAIMIIFLLVVDR